MPLTLHCDEDSLNVLSMVPMGWPWLALSVAGSHSAGVESSRDAVASVHDASEDKLHF